MINALVLLGSLVTAAQITGSPHPAPEPDYPFKVGEHLEYSAKLGMLKLGEASLRVVDIDTVRGKPSFMFRFHLQGGNFLFKIDNVLESWTTVSDFKSLRFRNDNTENDRRRLREYEIFPDSGFYRQAGQTEPKPTPAAPLDNASLLYFVRSTPLEVGKTYRFERYFQTEKNPLIVRVLKRERMSLPDGTEAECLLLNPVMDDRGMFADRAASRLWITDDARRLPVQIRSKYPWGTITLKLEKMELGAGDS